METLAFSTAALRERQTLPLYRRAVLTAFVLAMALRTRATADAAACMLTPSSCIHFLTLAIDLLEAPPVRIARAPLSH